MGRKFRYALGEPDERNVTVLTLKLRIALEPLDTGGEGGTAIVKARGSQFKCVHYPPAEFETFKTRFQRSVSQIWSGKIFVVELWGKLPAWVSLGVTVVLLIGGVVVSLWKSRNDPPVAAVAPVRE